MTRHTRATRPLLRRFLAYVGGPTAWLNGEPSTRAAAHEIGHNIGLGHASSLTCTGVKGRVALSADCTKESEYGDPFTLMGSGGTLHVNAIHKTQLGWLRPENIVDITASGTYELEPLGRSSNGTQVIRVPRGGSTLFIEYRRPVAAFERFGGPLEAAAGVTVRVMRGSTGALESLLGTHVPQPTPTEMRCLDRARRWSIRRAESAYTPAQLRPNAR